jgi:hypothetical protein
MNIKILLLINLVASIFIILPISIVDLILKPSYNDCVTNDYCNTIIFFPLINIFCVALMSIMHILMLFDLNCLKLYMINFWINSVVIASVNFIWIAIESYPLKAGLNDNFYLHLFRLIEAVTLILYMIYSGFIFMKIGPQLSKNS